MVMANRAHAYVPRATTYPKHTEIPRAKPFRRPGANNDRLKQVLAGILIFALALLVVYRNGQISQINREINRLDNLRAALVDEQRHLQIEIARLSALDRIEAVALNELGMMYPDAAQLRFVGHNNPERGDGDGE